MLAVLGVGTQLKQLPAPLLLTISSLATEAPPPPSTGVWSVATQQIRAEIRITKNYLLKAQYDTENEIESFTIRDGLHNQQKPNIFKWNLNILVLLM